MKMVRSRGNEKMYDQPQVEDEATKSNRDENSNSGHSLLRNIAPGQNYYCKEPRQVYNRDGSGI